jgi:hypothetical protein
VQAISANFGRLSVVMSPCAKSSRMADSTRF